MIEDGLPGWLHGVARRMIVDFEDANAIRHRGSKGTVREAFLIREFLSKYVPKHVEVVHSGEVRSTDAQVSPQQDVLIVDPMTPRLFTDDNYQVVPAECVYCIGEVKTHLGRAELDSSWKSGAAVKRLPKTAFRLRRNGPSRETGRFFAYGRPWWYFPTASFIFAYDSVSLDVIAGDMMAHGAIASAAAGGGSLEQFVDAVFVLRKGFVYWGQEGGGLHVRPQPDSTICAIESSEPGQVLIAMTSWLNDILADAWMPRFNIDGYIGTATLGNRMSWYPRPDRSSTRKA